MEKAKRKQIIAEYKQQKTTGGVYRILNKETGKSLIKSDINMEAIRNRFNFAQKTNTCIILKLQHDWNKYGSEAYVLETFEEIEIKNDKNLKAFRDRLKKLEEKWKEKYTEEQLY